MLYKFTPCASDKELPGVSILKVSKLFVRVVFCFQHGVRERCQCIVTGGPQPIPNIYVYKAILFLFSQPIVGNEPNLLRNLETFFELSYPKAKVSWKIHLTFYTV